MYYICYICKKNLNINNFLEIPTEDNFINFDNLKSYKEKYSYNNNNIIIKINDNFIFFYYIFCFNCFNNYLNYKYNYNIFNKLKNRELGL